MFDIGCGAGLVDLYFAKKGFTVTGIDISKKAIAAAKKSAKLIGLENRVEFSAIDFPNRVPLGTFDYILCSEVLEHLENDQLALEKLYQLLKKGGIAIISVPSENAVLYRLGLANGFDRRVGHLRRYTLEKLVAICKQSGFKIVDTRKTEGVMRNFLFVIPYAGKATFFLRSFIANVFMFFDRLSLLLFGESQIFVILKKQ